jgi:predicted dehydrogenase
VKCSLENRKYKDIPLEDTAEALIGYGEAEARLFFTWAGDARSNTVLIQGDRGSILVDDDTIRLETVEGRQDIPFPEALSQGSHHPEWYGEVIDDFVTEIRDPARTGRNFIEAGWCQAMMETCAVSSREGTQKRIVPPAGVNE